MSSKNNISIVVASDNHYAILIAALLKSIEINHKTAEHIDFYIIDDGISAKNKQKIIDSLQSDVITVRWFEKHAIIPEGVSIPVDKSAFPLTTYLRLFAPYALPPDVERLIYLDVDTIVMKDISLLWNADLNGCTIGAVLDVGKTVDCAWGGIPNYKDLGLLPSTKYFNAGIMLIDVIRWREEEISKKVIDALRTYAEHVVLVDQYGLNVVFANRWQELDPRWNWFATFQHDDPFIIHYLDIKPTFKSYRSQEAFRTIFYSYLNQTQWKGFRPISDNYRVVRKFSNKIKKYILNFFQ
ncbi:glycosyltransferase family 8 protein [Pedobacter hartonius]|uniref:Lipopolysaccharide biosynthesis protein, LPS:glycosyltransferase n=1 Tax=Pedobacter hartonius TaxID=425514 RepID=A0A1H4GK82_9SPHI|nr:glycosyltransferase family 8 protein [Pedobacter hartonius]SEB09258.1 Lipopolysaccharide biosynthesis protein, LPS:glycosyltransferase [Pedobacter hartonius]